jgi:SNF2 family DNA or RNA helicase
VIDNEKYGLFLDMGLGKTVSTLTAFSELQLLDTKKMLVIAKTDRISHYLSLYLLHTFDSYVV